MIPAMANYLDFLPVLDRYVRDRPDGCVRGGYEMLKIARDAGLVAAGDRVRRTGRGCSSNTAT